MPVMVRNIKSLARAVYTGCWRRWHSRHGQVIVRAGGRGDAGGWSARAGTYACPCGATRDVL